MFGLASTAHSGLLHVARASRKRVAILIWELLVVSEL